MAVPLSKPIPSLEKSELIGRGVYSGRLAKKARRNEQIHNAFLERLDVDKISVDRIDRAPLTVFVELGNEIARNRSNGNRKFYGWAVLTVRDAETNNRMVESSPLASNPYHADICLLNLPDEPKSRRIVQIQHAVDLAVRAKWKDVQIEA